MIPIICFGEALIDCLHIDDKKVDGINKPIYQHFSGGAPANVAVALSKLNCPVYFSGGLSTDYFGEQILNSLTSYKVSLDHIQRDEEHPTGLAFIHRDPNGERSFTFLRSNSADLHYQAAGLDFSIHPVAGIFHFCSNTLTEENIRKTTYQLILRAKELNWKISFDINFRKSLWADSENASQIIQDFLAFSDIVKASREEIIELWGNITNSEFSQLISDNTDAIFITDGGEPVDIVCSNELSSLEIPETQVEDTTAAGDSFIAGVLSCLCKKSPNSWTHQDFINAGSLGIKCGGITASRKGSYASLPYAHEIN